VQGLKLMVVELDLAYLPWQEAVERALEPLVAYQRGLPQLPAWA
jgi:hypothetical protein